MARRPLAALVVAFAAAVCLGANEAPAPAPPSDSLAWWHLDADAEVPARAALESIVNALARAFAPDPRQLRAPSTSVGRAAASEWQAHIAALGPAPSTPALLGFVNVNAFRRALPEAFAPGPGSRLLDAWSLSNARSVGFFASLVPADQVASRDPALPRTGASPPKYAGPPVVHFDLTASARSQAPGTVTRIPLTAAHWPAAQLVLPPPAGPFVTVVRADWPRWIKGAFATREAALPGGDAAEFRTAAADWQREQRANISGLIGAVTPWIVLTPTPSGVAFRAELRPDANPAAVRAALGALASPLRAYTTEGGENAQAFRVEPGWGANAIAWRVVDGKPGGRSAIMGAIVLGDANAETGLSEADRAFQQSPGR